MNKLQQFFYDLGVTVRHFGSFLKETALRLGAQTPGYLRRLGNLLLALAAVCFAFQEPFLAKVAEVTGYQIIPEHWLQVGTKYFMLMASFGKLVTLFGVDRGKLTDAQLDALEKLAKAQKENVNP